MKVYEKVRAYMDDHGLKQVAIAQKAGFSVVTFNAILNGKRTLYADDLRAICLALNVSPELFIDVSASCDRKTARHQSKSIEGVQTMENSISQAVAAVTQMENYLEGHLKERQKFSHTFIFHQLQKRRGGESFTMQDHIQAMVYSMLSGRIPWKRVETLSDFDTGTFPAIDQLFHQYDPKYLLSSDPDTLAQGIKDLGCASFSTWKQMGALVHTNIKRLVKMEIEHGGIDKFYAGFLGEGESPAELLPVLAKKFSRWKLIQMGEALVCEYLKNVGYDIAKPDTHIKRILGRRILGCSEQETVPPTEAIEIVAAIAKELTKPAAEVDYILWSYCATGFGEVCTAKNPKCQICPVRQFCNSKRGE